MIAYLLKSAACLALLLFFYHLVLEKEKMHNFNRFYLLIGVFASFLIPLATITTVVYVEPITFNPQEIIENPVFNDTTNQIILEETTIDYAQLFTYLYWIISALLFIRFGRNLFNIINKTRKNIQIKYQNAILVLVDDTILPHTFWNYIFINKNDYENQKIEQELFTHELTHVTQKHTIDILFIEILHAFFWINPLFIFLKKATQLNHEFLADEKVIKEHKNTFQYQHILVNKAAWNNEYYLASNLNYSLTKKRLKMMTTQSSQRKILLKKLAVIPLLAGFIFLFAERVEAQEIIEIEEDQIETIVEEVPFNKEDFFKSEIYKKYYYRNLTIKRKDKNGNTITKTYSELNDDEKARLVPPPPLKSKKQIPTQQQIEDLKDNNKYAVWIDGKVVKNDVLNNYKNTDFARYSNSHVYKNARSKRFPQENQASLQTLKYFNAQNKMRLEQFMDYVKKEYNIVEIKEIKEKDEIKEVIEQPKKKKYNLPSSNGSKQNIAVKGKQINYNNIVTPSITLEKYNYLNDLYEGDRNLKPHYVNSSVIRQNELEDLFSKLGSLYFKLSKEDKRKTKRPIHPHYPYLKLRKNNKIFYKLRKDLTEEDKLLIPPPPPNPKASKEEILKAKNAYNDWKKRSGNDLSVKEKKTTRKEISYKYRFSIYLNKDNKFDVFGNWVNIDQLKSSLEKTHNRTNKEETKAVLVVHTNAKKEVSQKAQEIIKEYGVLITVISNYVPWESDKNETIPPPTEEQKNQEIQLNKYLKLSENYIGNKNRTKKELEEIKKQYALLDETIKSNFMSPDSIIKNMKVLEAKHKIMMKAKQKEKVYKLIEPN